jgi:pyrroline-5-carboxylate reductase
MRIGLIGAGNMASALARGLGVPVVVSDVVEEKALALARDTGGEAVGSNAEVAERADVLVLCHKPGQLQEVAEQVGGRAKVVVTILAATTTEEVEEHYQRLPVYRFIPNIPVGVGRGVLCYAAGSRAAEGPEREILELFGRAGLIIPLDDESLLEPAMALMSCGPAFIALVAESFVDAGVHHGLSRDDASRMVVETMVGTAEYLKAHDLDTEALRVKVATPGGVTERGLMKLEEGALRAVCRLAVDTVVEATK